MDELRIELDCDTETAHFHKELELLYVLSGGLTVLLANTSFGLMAEDFVVFNPYEQHSLYLKKGSHMLSFYVPASVLRYAEVGRIQCCSSIHLEQAEYLQLIRSKLAVLFKACSQDRGNRLYLLSQLFSLLAVLKQEFEVSASPQTGAEGDNVQKALCYIGQHFTEPLSLQQVADEVYWSKSHLSREFQRRVGVPFEEYLRAQRMNLAAYLLADTDRSVTEIAVDSGFSNVSTLIANFNRKYGCTPGEYRAARRAERAEKQENASFAPVSFMGLLRHIPYEEDATLLGEHSIAPFRAQVDVRGEGKPLNLCHTKVISLGWACDLLQENIRDSIRRAKREFGFEYATFHGILDDSLDVYHEDADGQPCINTTYMDLMLDFLLSADIKPWIELGYTPNKLAGAKNWSNPYGASNILLPTDLEKWGTLIRLVLEHLIGRYGAERVSQWRFSSSCALYASYGVFTMEAYLPYYRATFEAVRACLPEAYIAGCTLDTGFLTLDGSGLLDEFLSYCAAHRCMPDAVSVQCIQCDYALMSREETERNISGRGELHLGEPARMSADPDIMQKELAAVRRVMEAHGIGAKEIVVLAWNSTHWQEDLGNDTCYKSAFLFRSVLNNCGAVSAMAYCYLTDHTERRIANSSVFHGGTGLVTYRSIPKAAYYAFTLLSRLEREAIASGEGYVVTRSADCKRICIGLYNYCHINPETHVTVALSESEQSTIDRYYGYENHGMRSFSFYLRGMDEGIYRKTSYSVNRRHGSSYDAWMEIGAPGMILSEQADYLNQCSLPGCYYESVRIEQNRELLIAALLEPHEIRVICLEKQ